MTFNTRRRINFFDCDPAGIMFFGNAFRLIHSAYEEMISSLGLKDYWYSEKFFVPITKTGTEYFFPVKSDSFVTIEVLVSELRDHSFELSYTCRGDDGKKLFISKTVHVFTDREFRKIKIPENIETALRKYSEPS